MPFNSELYSNLADFLSIRLDLPSRTRIRNICLSRLHPLFKISLSLHHLLSYWIPAIALCCNICQRIWVVLMLHRLLVHVRTTSSENLNMLHRSRFDCYINSILRRSAAYRQASMRYLRSKFLNSKSRLKC